MPIYDYKCRSCGQKFDEFNAIEDRNNASCPSCGGEGELQISAPMLSMWKDVETWSCSVPGMTREQAESIPTVGPDGNILP